MENILYDLHKLDSFILYSKTEINYIFMNSFNFIIWTCSFFNISPSDIIQSARDFVFILSCMHIITYSVFAIPLSGFQIKLLMKRNAFIGMKKIIIIIILLFLFVWVQFVQLRVENFSSHIHVRAGSWNIQLPIKLVEMFKE